LDRRTINYTKTRKKKRVYDLDLEVRKATNALAAIYKKRALVSGAAFAFVKRFGFLGRNRIARRTDRRFRALDGEPIEWIVAHSRAVNLALVLMRFLRSPHGEKGPTLFDEAKAWAGKPNWGVEIGVLAGTRMMNLSADTKADADASLGEILNLNLSGIVRTFGYSMQWRRSVFVRETLIEGIYWHLANLSEGTSDGIRACQLCGDPFSVKDPRQRFCCRKHAALKRQRRRRGTGLRERP
jgi:hypothetical protein